MNHIAMYFHSGCGNRGCEAIVRTTAAMLHQNFAAAKLHLYTIRPQEDGDLYGRDVDALFDMHIPEKGEFSLSLPDQLKSRLLSRKSFQAADEFFFGRYFEKKLPLIEDLYLSVGGDNYCYGDNTTLNAFHKMLKAHKKKTVLWGCSLEPSTFTPYTTEDLRRFDHIFVREHISEGLLLEHGFDKLSYHPDPAFTLPTEQLPLPPHFIEGKTVGINISPLIMKYESDAGKGVGFAAVQKLCDYILSETDWNIAFLPHVTWEFSNDLEPLSRLQAQYADSGRTVFFDQPLTAPQLKGYIARCRFFVGARTHATIAAYSSCVPTLVLGYSTKSKGIAQDLFGTDDGFVLPIQTLTDPQALTDAFCAIAQRETEIRDRLGQTIPQVIAASADAGKTLAKIMA